MKSLFIALTLLLPFSGAAHQVEHDIFEYATSIENLPNGDIVALVPKVPNIKYITADSQLTPVCNVLFRYKSAVEASIGVPEAFNDLYFVDQDGNMLLRKQVRGPDGRAVVKRIERLVCTNRY